MVGTVVGRGGCTAIAALAGLKSNDLAEWESVVSMRMWAVSTDRGIVARVSPLVRRR